MRNSIIRKKKQSAKERILISLIKKTTSNLSLSNTLQILESQEPEISVIKQHALKSFLCYTNKSEYESYFLKIFDVKDTKCKEKFQQPLQK